MTHLNGQASLVVVLLEALDGQTDVILRLDGALTETLGVVRLAAALPEKAKDYYMTSIEKYI